MTYLRAHRAGRRRARRAAAASAPTTSTPLLDRLDGICLSGGPDLDPAAYGAPSATRELGPTEPQLDALRARAGARRRLARGMPLLGICRGAQALNVARGGTLHQHVDGPPPDRARHRARARGARSRRARALPRVLGPATLAGQLLPPPGGRRARRRPARRRRAAPDGTIEAIEDAAHPFLLGVQWHAETLVDAPSQLRALRARSSTAAT